MTTIAHIFFFFFNLQTENNKAKQNKKKEITSKTKLNELKEKMCGTRRINKIEMFCLSK